MSDLTSDENAASAPSQWFQHRSRKDSAESNSRSVHHSSPFDISDLIDEHTMDFRSQQSHSHEALFEPTEITGRSTMHTLRPTTLRRSSITTSLPSTEDILSQSGAEDVRQLAVSLSEMKVRQSYGGRTADMSLASSASGFGSARGGAGINPWGDDGFKRNAESVVGKANNDLYGASFRSTNVSCFWLLTNLLFLL